MRALVSLTAVSLPSSISQIEMIGKNFAKIMNPRQKAATAAAKMLISASDGQYG
jgi:hypothetical protein